MKKGLSGAARTVCETEWENRLIKTEESNGGGLEFETFIFEEAGSLSEASFRAFLKRIPLNVFRIKGAVGFRERAFMLNHVGGRSHWMDREGTGGTKLVFVGWDLDTEAILKDLKACREG